jgi:hypothetical protein
LTHGCVALPGLASSVDGWASGGGRISVSETLNAMGRVRAVTVVTGGRSAHANGAAVRSRFVAEAGPVRYGQRSAGPGLRPGL